jgi:hypothetical protein
MKRYARELAIGARLTLEGGRESLLRMALTALGVGLGVVVLLGAASGPQALDAGEQRTAARNPPPVEEPPRGADTLLLGFSDTTFRDDHVRGRQVRAEGPQAPLPPGVERLPGPGELVVSPALARRLRDPLLRARIPGRIVGTIGDAGLVGPHELAYYAGSATLEHGAGVLRLAAFGGERLPLEPLLYVLITIMVVVLLAPIGVFIASAVRFGGEARERRLAAVRLLGADRGMASRIAAGESLVGALAGLVVGALLFVAVRPFAERVELWNLSVFAADLRPSPVLGLLIAVLVPASAVLVTLVSLRRVVVEPLGVVRQAGGRPRRVLWRAALPLAGLAILAPLLDQPDGQINGYQLAAGMALVLGGVTALLPWLVERVVGRLRGGGVPWQLATRRLQLESGSAVRAVSGITVAIAGAIGLQMVFSGAEETNRIAARDAATGVRSYVEASPGTGQAEAARLDAALRAAPGVRTVLAYEESRLLRKGQEAGMLIVGGCAELRRYGRLGACADGDAFVLRDDTGGAAQVAPGERLRVDGAQWRVPADAPVVSIVADPIGWARGGVLATPGAVRSLAWQPTRTAFFTLDGNEDAIEHARNAVAAVNPLAQVQTLGDYVYAPGFAFVRRALFAAASLVLVLIGASLLVGLLEQLRDRRRLLAALVAVGARRSTLSWSVLIQTAIPVALGVLLSVAAGVGLGAILLVIVSGPVRIDVGAIAVMVGAGTGVVLLVTALSLPALWRLMRPEGLRTE